MDKEWYWTRRCGIDKERVGWTRNGIGQGWGWTRWGDRHTKLTQGVRRQVDAQAEQTHEEAQGDEHGKGRREGNGHSTAHVQRQ